MCQQSAVINGRYDKKGALEEGQPAPIGTAECLRLVGEFQGGTDDDHNGRAEAAGVAALHERLDNLEQRYFERAAEIEQEQQAIRTVATRSRTPQVTETIVQQPMFDAEQRAYFKTLRIDETTDERESEDELH
jgi:hypothetical protein